MYLCKLIMRKVILSIISALAILGVGCSNHGASTTPQYDENVVAVVDGHVLLRDDINRDMPNGLTGVDSVTFARMYIDNWVLNRLKMERAEQVLSSYEKDIERLVEGYRQSLIIRQLDQYYIDNAIDIEITDKQLASYYRAHSASFKLDHDKVLAVVVKTPRNFRNVSTLTTALKGVARSGSVEEVAALAEKHNLQLSNLMDEWVSYSDFLSHLPTERSQSYASLLTKSGVQTMTSDNATFYFIIIDVVRKGEVAPIECVEDDIRRRLYAERRAGVVDQYESDLRREAVAAGRVLVVDSVLMKSMSYAPEGVDKSAGAQVRDAEELIEDDVPHVGVVTVQNSENVEK